VEIVDYIIVGGGCTGSITAHTLSGLGKQVIVLDTGIDHVDTQFSASDFIAKRMQDYTQSDFFLGKNFEVLSDQKHPNIPQQTAQRIYMSEQTDTFIPHFSKTFFPVESLAFGGLGNGWGLGSYVFSTPELIKTGLPIENIRTGYKKTASLIGISGESKDDASRFCHNNEIDLQATIRLNSSAEHLLTRYNKQQQTFHSKHIYIGRPSLALLTENHDERKAYGYKDLDFYENEGYSAFRPKHLIQKLTEQGQIQYLNNWLVLKFEEHENYISIHCLHTESYETNRFYAKKLILASGTLGTARIVLRSKESSQQLPILCNAYTYMPMIYMPCIGVKHDGQQSGFAQLALFYDKYGDHSDVTMASVYNYRSLLNFRILKQMPLNVVHGEQFLKLILPSLFIAGIFHPVSFNNHNYIQLKKEDSITGDQLHSHYEYSQSELEDYKQSEKIISSSFKKLKCMPLKKVRTPLGGSIHYSGSLPFKSTDEHYSINPNGKLGGFKHIYIADGSGISYLPGKGLTLTLMANAYQVALNALKND
jgi:hypothetical protein